MVFFTDKLSIWTSIKISLFIKKGFIDFDKIKRILEFSHWHIGQSNLGEK